MKHDSLLVTALAIAAIATLGSFACTTETTVVKSAADPDSGSGGPGDSPDADVKPEGDAATNDAAIGDGKIGTRSDKGEKTVDVNFSSHGSYSCDAVCMGAGGTCMVGGGNGVGWVDRKYNDGSGTFGNQISSCSDSESYVSINTTMTGMTCFCSGMTVPPTVRVKKAEGFFACSKVCSSWSLKCSTTRKDYAYSDEEETSSTMLADCNAVPDATTHHYLCACDL